MATITLITGNQQKLDEWRRLLPPSIVLDHQAVDLTEIQSLNSTEIVTDKVKRAYAVVKRPVVVEDVTAGLDELNGLPGPFIKFFEENLGRTALSRLARSHPAPAKISCTIAYYDGRRLEFFNGTVSGVALAEDMGGGFGFDGVFVPEGKNKTYGQMGPAEKDKCSHRHLAVNKLIEFLETLDS